MEQQSFRGRNSDGSETTATWIDIANNDWSQDVDATFRVRFLIENTGAGAFANGRLQLWYNLASAGWNPITASSSVVQATSDGLTDEGTTTQQIGSGTHDGTMGQQEGDAVMNTNFGLAVGSEHEFECTLTIVSADVTNGQTIQLQVQDTTTELNAYNQTPTITVVEAVAAFSPQAPPFIH